MYDKSHDLFFTYQIECSSTVKTVIFFFLYDFDAHDPIVLWTKSTFFVSKRIYDFCKEFSLYFKTRKYSNEKKLIEIRSTE